MAGEAVDLRQAVGDGFDVVAFCWVVAVVAHKVVFGAVVEDHPGHGVVFLKVLVSAGF